MVVLEEEGYLGQPHTSAGRTPTEKGYKYFVENITRDGGEIDQNALLWIEKSVQLANTYNELVKNLAKTVAEITHETILVGFSEHDFYYTGISNFFRKPEFQNRKIIIDMAEVIDDLDKKMENVFPCVNNEPKVLIGHENPFSNDCATIIMNLNANGKTGIFGLLGLMRMNYEDNLALVNHIKKFLDFSTYGASRVNNN